MLADKALTKVLSKYLDYADVFLFDLAIELLENTGMNEYIIKLIKGKQPPYRPIYKLKPIELEILKTYIETHPRGTKIIPHALNFFVVANFLFCIFQQNNDQNNHKSSFANT